LLHEALDASTGYPPRLPVLCPDHLRVAVRDPATSRTFGAAFAEVMTPHRVHEEIR
jgi:hypothetical protein